MLGDKLQNRNQLIEGNRKDKNGKKYMTRGIVKNIPINIKEILI